MSKILVVEDDADIAMAISIRLRKDGYEVLVAGDGLTATQQALREAPDLVLLDISMPCGGGFGVADRLNSNSNTMGTPVIFMTASKDAEHRARADELGAVAFFEKPYEYADLRDAIERSLSTVRTDPEHDLIG